jgi:hypothetical protein
MKYCCFACVNRLTQGVNRLTLLKSGKMDILNVMCICDGWPISVSDIVGIIPAVLSSIGISRVC